jgi:hypothetical protein
VSAWTLLGKRSAGLLGFCALGHLGLPCQLLATARSLPPPPVPTPCPLNHRCLCPDRVFHAFLQVFIAEAAANDQMRCALLPALHRVGIRRPAMLVSCACATCRVMCVCACVCGGGGLHAHL